jgi:hypothetical protein
LTESGATIILVDFDAEEEIEEAEVTHLEGPLHLRLEGLHLRFFRVGDDEIVDVDAN